MWILYFFLSVGEPITIPKIDNPSQKEVDFYHSMYVDSLVKLFDKYKSKFGLPETEVLEVNWRELAQQHLLLSESTHFLQESTLSSCTWKHVWVYVSKKVFKVLLDHLKNRKKKEVLLWINPITKLLLLKKKRAQLPIAVRIWMGEMIAFVICYIMLLDCQQWIRSIPTATVPTSTSYFGRVGFYWFLIKNPAVCFDRDSSITGMLHKSHIKTCLDSTRAFIALEKPLLKAQAGCQTPWCSIYCRWCRKPKEIASLVDLDSYSMMDNLVAVMSPLVFWMSV